MSWCVTRSLLLGLSQLGFVACTGSDEAACDDAGVSACDVRSEACQARLFNQMRCLRGDPAELNRPEVATLSEAEVREILEIDSGDFQLDEEEIAAHNALSLFGLVASGELTTETQVEVTLDGLLGFYTAETNEIVLLDIDGEEFDGLQAVTTLGHEFVHALQQADFGIDDYRSQIDDGFDHRLAATTVLEGEATLYEKFLEAELMDFPIEDVNWEVFYSGLTDAADEFSAQEPGPQELAFALFPYTYGGFSSFDVWDREGLAGLVDLRQPEAPSTLTDLARRHQRRSLDVDVSTVARAETPEGLEYVGHDMMGAWVLHGFLSSVLGVETTPDQALRWRGDGLTVFSSDDGVAAAWQIEWASSSDAQRFAGAVGARDDRPAGSPGGGVWVVGVDGSRSRLFAGSDQSLLAMVAGLEVEQPLNDQPLDDQPLDDQRLDEEPSSVELAARDLPSGDDSSSSSPRGNALRRLLGKQVRASSCVH